jgi:hypothetical protein
MRRVAHLTIRRGWSSRASRATIGRFRPCRKGPLFRHSHPSVCICMKQPAPILRGGSIRSAIRITPSLPSLLTALHPRCNMWSRADRPYSFSRDLGTGSRPCTKGSPLRFNFRLRIEVSPCVKRSFALRSPQRRDRSKIPALPETGQHISGPVLHRMVQGSRHRLRPATSERPSALAAPARQSRWRAAHLKPREKSNELRQSLPNLDERQLF